MKFQCLHLLFGIFILFSFQLLTVLGHGRLVKPPARGTAWRKGFKTPADYTDNEENCGGFGVQWNTNNGKCGICGDPWHGVKENETPGKYATGTIVANYNKGQVIDVDIEITSNHKGWVEFKLCENNNVKKDKDQACFDKHLLEFAGAFDGKTRAALGQGTKIFSYKLKLPKDVQCNQCILQWHYNAGNGWGVDKVTGKGCIGCGPQETFMGCADIKIGEGGAADEKEEEADIKPDYKPNTKPVYQPDSKPDNKPGGKPAKGHLECIAIGSYKWNPGMGDWCERNCNVGNCPPDHCQCNEVP